MTSTFHDYTQAVLELAWRNDLMDAAMPYVIQSVKQYTGKIDNLDVREQKKEKEEEKSKSAVNDFVPDMPMGGGKFFFFLDEVFNDFVPDMPMGGGKSLFLDYFRVSVIEMRVGR